MTHSQQRLDQRMEELAQAHKELAQIQKEGERSRIELREAMASLARTTESTKAAVDGLAHNQAYGMCAWRAHIISVRCCRC